MCFFFKKDFPFQQRQWLVNKGHIFGREMNGLNIKTGGCQVSRNDVYHVLIIKTLTLLLRFTTTTIASLQKYYRCLTSVKRKLNKFRCAVSISAVYVRSVSILVRLGPLSFFVFFGDLSISRLIPTITTTLPYVTSIILK